MNFNSPKSKAFVLSSASLVVVGLIVFLVVIPLNKKIYKQKDLLEESKLTFEKDKENIDKYKQDLEYFKSEDFVNERLEVTEENRVQIIKGLEQIAFDYNLDQKIETYTSTIGKKNNKKDKNKTFLKIKIEGKYRDFMTFFYKLENFKYSVNVESLIIENLDESRFRDIRNSEELEKLPEINSEIIITFS